MKGSRMEEQKKWQHLMIDLETLGKTSDAVILSIGAVPFSMDGTIGEPFEAYPTVQDQFSNRKIEWSTIQWWMQQEEIARNSITSPFRNVSLQNELIGFNNWCVWNLHEKFRIWSNGASFDIATMRHAFTQYNIEVPWSYKKEMDCRTMVYMSNISTHKYESDGIKHNAVDDCKWQIHWTVDAFHILRGTYE